MIELPKIPTVLEVPKATPKPKVEEKDVMYGRKMGETEVAVRDYAKNNGKVLYSYSRLGSMNECKYGYYLSYVEKRKGRENIYSRIGGIFHDVLEDFTNKKISRDEMISKFETSYKSATLVGLRFPNESIEKNYISSIRSFLRDYNPPSGNILTEEFIYGSFGNGILMQGFIDEIICYEDDDGNKTAVISDHKTSTKFKASDLLKYGRQLVLYADMYTRATGITVNKVMWNMAKYVTVSVPNKTMLSKIGVEELREHLTSIGVDVAGMKKGDLISSVIANRDSINIDDIVRETVYLRAELSSKMIKHLPKDDRIGVFIESNSVSDIPSDILEDLYTKGIEIKPYYEVYEITKDIVNEMENYVIDTVMEIEHLAKQNIKAKYEPKDIGKSPFFCQNLCNHGHTCEHYKRYNQSLMPQF